MIEKLKDKNILFLEDNVEFAENTLILLNVFVKNVYHSLTISDAEHILDTQHIDIIICDIKLKNESGLDFIENFRKLDKTTPIVIISGHKDETFLFKAIPLELTDYLLKPIKYDKLMESLNKCSDKLSFNNKEKIHIKNGYYYSKENKIVIKDGKNFTLNKKEVLFMELLSSNLNRLITKEMIFASVWEFEEMSNAALTNFILRIRKRFGKDFIYTIPELGFKVFI